MQVQGPTCEQHTMSETVLPKTQTTSPTTPHCWRISPRWSALWAPRHPEPRPHHPEPRPHRHQTGGVCTIRGATRRRHAGRMLLMVQNPHRQRCDALRKGQRARASPGAACFPTTPPPNGGNCSIRGATRRRHAVARLLMVQNPHHYPWCHAPSLASCSLTGVTLSHWCGAARRGADKRRKGVADGAHPV